MSTQIKVHDLAEFSSPVTQITNAATKELGAFLCAVSQVFGYGEVEKAADLWIARFEETDWIDSNKEHTCRQVTIQTLACLVEARSIERATRNVIKSEQPSQFEWSRA